MIGIIYMLVVLLYAISKEILFLGRKELVIVTVDSCILVAFKICISSTPFFFAKNSLLLPQIIVNICVSLELLIFI